MTATGPMSEDPTDARLQQDRFMLYNWATGGDARRRGRKYSDRATQEHNVSTDETEAASLGDYAGGDR